MQGVSRAAMGVISLDVREKRRVSEINELRRNYISAITELWPKLIRFWSTRCSDRCSARGAEPRSQILLLSAHPTGMVAAEIANRTKQQKLRRFKALAGPADHRIRGPPRSRSGHRIARALSRRII
jgi:hypothetical protein